MRSGGRTLFLAFAVLLGAGGLVILAYFHFFPQALGRYPVPENRVFIFPGVEGPREPTVVPTRTLATWRSYDRGGPSRLAILLTDTTSAWLGLAHGLKSIGVPFRMTTDSREALRHRVVLVYPLISGKVLSAEPLRALAAVPRNGGTLIGVNVLGGGLEEVFGFQEAVPSRRHAVLTFTDAVQSLLRLSDPLELSLRLSDSTRKDRALGLYGYTHPRFPPLATYEDGTAAITQRSYGRGQAYALGIDPGALVLQAYNDREEWIARSYVNGYEPSVDVILRLLKQLYLAGEPDGVVLGTVPEGKSLMVSLTHDLDFTRSMVNALEYARYERQQGISGTYFVQTKYVRDYNDDDVFTRRRVGVLRTLDSLGMELASHTVAHAKPFNNFLLGTGRERYPDYRPYVMDHNTAYNGSILGELRVSKFLVERFSGQRVRSFRPGELSNPYRLPEALAATGYLYSSSVTANSALTHLPFQLNYSRESDAETGIFEFPLTIEDEEVPRMGDRLPAAVALATKLRTYGGSFVILIHPNILDHKMAFEQGFVSAVKEFAWFGSIGQCGEWWAARNSVDLEVQRSGRSVVVTLNAPRRIRGLTLAIPGRWKLKVRRPASLAAKVTPTGLLLGELAGSARLTFADTP